MVYPCGPGERDFLLSHLLWLSLGGLHLCRVRLCLTRKVFLLGERWRKAIAHRRDAGEDALNVRGGDDVGFGLACRDPGGSGYLKGGSWEPFAGLRDDVDCGGVD